MLDQLVDDEAIPDLVGALDDDDPEVLRRALHALACDQCKQNECHPGDELWVDRALELARHANVDVRAGAIDALAKASRRRVDVSDALLAIAEREPDRGLSEMARKAAR